jgi:glycosyltransferase involved in cell wall biosynthesis
MANDKLKVLCISRSYGLQAGGMERLSYEFIEALGKQPNIEMQKIVLPFTAGTSLRTHHLRSILFSLYVIPEALIEARKVDVVHLGDPLLSLAGWLIKIIWNKKVVVNVHGLDVSYPNALYQWYLKAFFTGFAGYTAISQEAKQHVMKLNVQGRIEVIPPGIHDRLFDPTKTRFDVSELLGFDVTGKTILLTHGRLVARKGHAWFIKHVLPALSPAVHYVISGDGPQRANLDALVETLGLKDQVHFLGKVSEEQVSTLYAGADIYVQPNISVAGDSEGFGLVVLEAATCEAVVLAANLEGLKEAIADGHNGMLIESGNAPAWQEKIQDVMNMSSEDRRALGKQAREYTLEKFGWGKIIEKHCTILTEI